MTSFFRTILWSALLGVLFTPGAQAQRKIEKSPWEQSVVLIEATRKQYDYFQPWSRRVKNLQKSGVVVAPGEVLTTADELFDRTLIRLQKGGRGKWWPGELKWIDYHANLAVIGCAQAAFWGDLKPASLEDFDPGRDTLQLARWRGGNLEIRKTEFNRFVAEPGRLTFVSYAQIEASTEIQGVGWGEPMIAGGKLVGLTTSTEGNNCNATTASFIKSILEARRKGAFKGLGFFDFYWQQAENPAVLAYLKQEGETRGVVVTDISKKLGPDPILKPHDVILKVEGFEIDTHGDYEDPDFGYLNLENLATRGKWAGDTVKMDVWRDGKALQIEYVLPKADYTTSLVPDATYDQPPEYLIAGGLVFQPLTDSFLHAFGADWRQRAPFRLQHFNTEDATVERPALVMLSQVLPDAFNIGYHELKYLVVDEVNGRKISRLADLQKALESPVNGFHRIELIKSDSLRHVVIAEAWKDAANKRIMQRYGIQEPFVILSPAEKSGGQPAQP